MMILYPNVGSGEGFVRKLVRANAPKFSARFNAQKSSSHRSNVLKNCKFKTEEFLDRMDGMNRMRTGARAFLLSLLERGIRDFILFIPSILSK